MTAYAADVCPSRDDVFEYLMALLPRGRAWQSDDRPARAGAVLQRFWYAIAGPVHDFEVSCCAMLAEFVCASHTALSEDLWLAEYGLPDICGAGAETLCELAAGSGAGDDFIVATALAAGWTITLDTIPMSCIAYYGRTLYGGTSDDVFLKVTIDTPGSPDPGDIDLLKCLLDRIVPAHVAILYEVIP